MMAAGGLALGLNRWTRGALNFKDLEQTPCSTAYLSVTQKKSQLASSEMIDQAAASELAAKKLPQSALMPLMIIFCQTSAPFLH